jgi:hypothetical protein
VLRRSLTVLFALGLAAGAAGCTTFSDSDAVARVEDTELERDAFQATLTDAGVTESDVVNADAVRAEITTWIQEQIAALPVDTDALAGNYDAGVAASGLLCLSAIVVADEATANAALAELEAGTAFPDLFAEFNLDEQLTATGGALPCLTSGDIGATEGVPFLEVAVDLNAASPLGIAPLSDASGAEIAWVVLDFRTFDELTPDDLAAMSAASTTADVHVDPRYGTFDRTTSQVVPLG